MNQFARIVGLSFLSCAALFTAPGCSGGGGGGGSGAGGSSTISGTITVPSTGGPIVEAEPNDTVEQAHFLGTLVAGQTIVVTGNVSPGDVVDGFKVTAPSRVKVTATLTFDDSMGNAFDIGIFDTIPGDFVEAFLGNTSPASGSFHAQGTFFPVVAEFTGSGNYTLKLVAATPTDPIAEREPNDGSTQGQYLGSLEDGQQIRLSGNANAVSDTEDHFLIDIPEALDVAASLQHPGIGAGANFDVVYDDATDLLMPVNITSFTSPTNNPETGTASIAPLTLLDVVVVAAAGSGNYTLTLTAVASDDFAPSGHAWRMTALAHPSRTRLSPAVAFGTPVLESMPGELLVLPRAGRDVSAELARRGLRVDARVPGGVMKCVAEIAPGASDELSRRRTLALAASFAACDAVEYAEPNFIRRAYDTPNDPFFNLQWHYAQIQLPAAWDITHGDNLVRVGIIDTGETQHPDLVARLIPGFDFISSPTIAGDGDGVDPDPTDVGDSQGNQPSSFHGTHVAGTVGADTDTIPPSGVAGVNWFGKLMHLRVLGKGGGNDFDIAQAVLYSAGLPNAATAPLAAPLDVINMSLGGPGFSQTFQNACTAAHNAGVTIFAAAGNENSTVDSFPASYADVISVAAVDLNAQRAFYSNHNSHVDLAAPGGDTTKDLNGDGFADGVLSTAVDDSSGTPVFTFKFEMGTSMACPHAAGVAALMKAINPSLTPAQIETILTTTATDLGAPGRDDLFGFGLVNAFQAVLQASNGTPVNPVLGLSTQSLSFLPGVTALNVQVFNNGGGTLHVGTPIVATDTGGPWLSAARVLTNLPPNSDTSAISVTVDRTGLADGAYTGSVTVPSDGTNGSLVIQVSLQVDSTPTPQNVPIFVIAVDSTTGASVFQDVVNPASSLAYAIPTLPAGSYFVFAGSDDDNDGFICGPGDQFCGAFPTLDQPVAITVATGEAVPAIDFAVQENFQGAAVSHHRKFAHR